MLYTKIYRMYTKGAKGHNLIGRGQPKDKYSLPHQKPTQSTKSIRDIESISMYMLPMTKDC